MAVPAPLSLAVVVLAGGLVACGSPATTPASSAARPASSPAGLRAAERALNDRKIGRVGRLTVRIGGLFSPRTRELNETLYQWERPFLVDDSKWQRAFGPYQPVSLAEAVERTLTWFKSRQLPR